MSTCGYVPGPRAFSYDFAEKKPRASVEDASALAAAAQRVKMLMEQVARSRRELKRLEETLAKARGAGAALSCAHSWKRRFPTGPRDNNEREDVCSVCGRVR